MNRIANFLNKYIAGNVFDKASILDAYSYDKSILKIKPSLVALPDNTADLIKIVKLINRLNDGGIKIPITIRGSGTSKNGSSLGKGLIILTEKLNSIKELDPRSRLIRVQAGITLEELNQALATHGLHLPVNANPKSTIGGLIAGHPYDSKIRKYGGIFYFVEQAEIILANGETVQTGRYKENSFSKTNDPAGALYREIKNVYLKNKRTIDNIPTKDIINFSNYKTVAHSYNSTNKSLDVMPLLFGSEGSLAIITEVILRCELLSSEKLHIAFDFKTIREAIENFNILRSIKPEEMNIFSKDIINNALEQGKTNNSITKNLQGEFLGIAEFSFKNKLQKRIKLKKLQKLFSKQKVEVIFENINNKNNFNEINNLITTYKNNTNSERLSILDNVLIPENTLAKFVQKISEYRKDSSLDLSIFGSFTNGVYTVLPLFNLNKAHEKKAILKFIKDYSSIVSEVNGMPNAMEPEGRVRSLIDIANLSLAERKLADEVKSVFDPDGILNPGIKTDTDLLEVISQIKKEPNKDILK